MLTWAGPVPSSPRSSSTKCGSFDNLKLVKQASSVARIPATTKDVGAAVAGSKTAFVLSLRHRRGHRERLAGGRTRDHFHVYDDLCSGGQLKRCGVPHGFRPVDRGTTDFHFERRVRP